MSVSSSKKLHTRAQTYSQRGMPSSVVSVKDGLAVAALREGEVLVKVTAAALNPVDWKIMSLIPSILVRRNTIVGSDYSGQILASRSTSFSIDDHVYGLVAPGPFKIFRGLGSVADTIVVPDTTCAKRPEHVDPVEAAGIALVGLTAVTLYQQVEETVKKHDNARILVCGGSSSVGAMVIPILKHHGCTVTATCSAPKADVVRKRGADHVLDYRDSAYVSALSQHTGEHGTFHCVVDCVDDYDAWKSSPTILNETGVYTSVGYDFTNGIPTVIRRVIDYQFRPVWLGGIARRFTRPGMFNTKANMSMLSSLVQEGVLTPFTDSTYGFDQTVEAFTRLQTNRATGKVLVRL